MVKKYRMRSVPFEAIQYASDNWVDCVQFCPPHTVYRVMGGTLLLKTPGGDVTVHDGDYIIKGAQGECHLYEQEAFDETFEAI